MPYACAFDDRSVVRLERRPVHAQDNAVRASIGTGGIGPGWNPVQRHTTDVDCAAVLRHIVANVVVAQLEQSTACSQAAVGGQQLPVVTLLVHDVRSLNRWSEMQRSIEVMIFSTKSSRSTFV
jgi:hypothetical protein